MSDTSDAPNHSEAIRARGLRRRFGALAAVDGIDLAVRQGEIFGLVGPDGAGKTTTMRMLCGILDPTEGETQVAGYDVRRQPEQVKRRIGYMPQRFSLYTDLTVAENLLFFAGIYHVPRPERLRREQRLLDFSRLAPFRTRLAGDLSGGMKQKLALACTLIHTPTVLLLDEPTTGVDPVSRRDLWKILYSLLGEGVTLFVTTPYMDEAERCHRVALMDRGRILLCDTPDALKQRMKGDLLELIAQPQRRAKETLSALPEVRGLQVFGDRLHVSVADASRDEPLLLRSLRDQGIQVIASRRALPGLEDVFVSVLSEERR
jgi:ABC-2 type transport system ATP-binding protein